MKYYESNFDEYLCSYEHCNIHPELNDIKSKFPKNITEFKNLIIYGPPGVGKYTQTLSILQIYSPSKLKYDKKISMCYEKQEKKNKTAISSTTTATPTTITSTKPKKIEENTLLKKKTKKKSTNMDTKTTITSPTTIDQNISIPTQMKKPEKKTEYTYRISDIHYEIDMATLGCNSKLIWHDLFFQIIDIISMSSKSDRIGIIVCKNFHCIHNELLEIFYSYIRHPLQYLNIQIQFILITEHIGFIPCNIINTCEIISIGRPEKDKYIQMAKLQTKSFSCFSGNIKPPTYYSLSIFENIDSSSITNSKEIHSFGLYKQIEDIPMDIFNIINNKIIEQILSKKKIDILELRNNLYDLLIYNIDIYECIWHIFTFLIMNHYLKKKDIIDIFNPIFVFFKYYNNNYRSIYHLESILLCMITKIHFPNESSKSISTIGNGNS